MAAKLKVRSEGGSAPAPSPTEMVTQPVVSTMTVTSEEGRRITFTKLGPMQRMRLFEAIGAEAAANEKYIGIAALAAAVTEIDGERVPFARNKRELEAIVDRLGDDGLNAIGLGIAKMLGYILDAEGKLIGAPEETQNLVAAAKN